MSETRERILSAACDLYLEHGLEGFSMRKLARAVGVTAPALYRHYESREAVLQDVVREAYRKFAEYLYRALQGRTPAERFRLAGSGYLRFALEHERLYEMLFVSPDHAGWEAMPEELASQVCAIGQFWHDRVRECVDEEILRAGDPHEISVTMWAHAHGLVTLYLRGMLPVDRETFQGVYLGSVLRMMRGLGGRRAEVLLSEYGDGNENDADVDDDERITPLSA